MPNLYGSLSFMSAGRVLPWLRPSSSLSTSRFVAGSISSMRSYIEWSEIMQEERAPAASPNHENLSDGEDWRNLSPDSSTFVTAYSSLASSGSSSSSPSYAVSMCSLYSEYGAPEIEEIPDFRYVPSFSSPETQTRGHGTQEIVEPSNLITRAIPIEVKSLLAGFTSHCISSLASVEFRSAATDASGGEESVYVVLSSTPRRTSAEMDGVESVSIPVSSVMEIDLLPSGAVYSLRSMAKQIIEAGYAPECFQAYESARRAALETTLLQLGMNRSTPADDDVKAKLRHWIRAARAFFRVVLASERRLCDLTFEGLEYEAKDSQRRLPSWTPGIAFMKIVKGAVNKIFGFANAIPKEPWSPEQIFSILDLHDALNDLIPDIEYVFRVSSSGGDLESTSRSALSDSAADFVNQAAGILARLADAIRRNLSDFESAVHHDASQVHMPNGGVHPLTRYVMNYILVLTDYKQSLDNIIVSLPSPTALSGPADRPHAQSPPAPEVNFHQLENDSPWSAHLVWIMAILDAKLEAHSRAYKDPALASIFVMNNTHYMDSKVKASPEMRQLIGDRDLRRLYVKRLQAATAYMRATWVKALHYLTSLRDVHIGPTGRAFKAKLKERFKAFNAAFEEVHRKQSSWFVPDPQLKQELRISISPSVLQAYRAFLGQYGFIIENGMHPESYIKYTVEQLEILLEDFFEGKAPAKSSP